MTAICPPDSSSRPATNGPAPTAGPPRGLKDALKALRASQPFNWLATTSVRAGLRRGIRRFDAIALVVGSMIGSGIFIVSA